MTKFMSYLSQFSHMFGFFNNTYGEVFITVLALLVMIGVYKFAKDFLPW